MILSALVAERVTYSLKDLAGPDLLVETAGQSDVQDQVRTGTDQPARQGMRGSRHAHACNQYICFVRGPIQGIL